METNEWEDADIEKMLDRLADTPARDPQAQAQGRAHFLAQAQGLASEVSRKEEVRHTRWNPNFFERILKPMKRITGTSALAAAVILVVVVAIIVAGSVTTVSASQILTRAIAAQTPPAHGIWHTRIQIYENHAMLAGDHPGTTTIDEDYLDTTKGQYRSIIQDGVGDITQVNAFDGTYTYFGLRTDGDNGNNPLKVERVKAGSDQGVKTRSMDPAAIAKSLFDDFLNNPRVRVDPQRTWTDGRSVYILVDDNTQNRKGSNGTVYTGSVRMVFDAKTYRLIENRTTVRKDGQDIVIDEAQWLVDEVLPSGSPVAWDLSDLKGITIVDGTPSAQASPTFETLTEQELATHTKSFYTLKPLPTGYTEKITAVADQPKDQDYQFEINYTGPKGETFGLQAVGQMDPGFVASSFYDGSYKAATGLVVYYSPSHPGGGTSAMLMASDGNGFLLISSLPREQVQILVETLVKGQ